MVNKFGGTSVASAEAMVKVKNIVMDQVDRYKIEVQTVVLTVFFCFVHGMKLRYPVH